MLEVILNEEAARVKVPSIRSTYSLIYYADVLCSGSLRHLCYSPDLSGLPRQLSPNVIEIKFLAS